MLRSDRVFGLVVILAALAYIASALQLQTSFLSDPMGSKSFPIGLGAVAVLCGIVMIFKPEDEAEWPAPVAILKIFISVVVMVAYAYALKPLGFLIPTTLAAGILSYLITPRLTFNVMVGIGLAIGLYLLFRYALGLETLQAIPKGWGG
ncbi:tripartite tricarboxylate transporter TctB family protein [Tateyamaria sp. Alg231-49]|uniref:tripartite tricarboxylate transporter TctB family protein n=1 Tax=Tateyamaria sp. Alg231-49 TaxID=1922219 RepID=UPI000D562468|nr:tripartite tricarboxylate transporter TctB family protein [Tateyamaria sp. Alg231-49]